MGKILWVRHPVTKRFTLRHLVPQVDGEAFRAIGKDIAMSAILRGLNAKHGCPDTGSEHEWNALAVYAAETVFRLKAAPPQQDNIEFRANLGDDVTVRAVIPKAEQSPNQKSLILRPQEVRYAPQRHMVLAWPVPFDDGFFVDYVGWLVAADVHTTRYFSMKPRPGERVPALAVNVNQTRPIEDFPVKGDDGLTLVERWPLPESSR